MPDTSSGCATACLWVACTCMWWGWNMDAAQHQSQHRHRTLTARSQRHPPWCSSHEPQHFQMHTAQHHATATWSMCTCSWHYGLRIACCCCASHYMVMRLEGYAVGLAATCVAVPYAVVHVTVYSCLSLYATVIGAGVISKWAICLWPWRQSQLHHVSKRPPTRVPAVADMRSAPLACEQAQQYEYGHDTHSSIQSIRCSIFETACQ